MGEHIKKLSSDKIKVERRLQEAEKETNGLQMAMEAVESALERKGMTLEGILGHKYRHLLPSKDESSLDLNDFIQENLTRQQSQAPTPR